MKQVQKTFIVSVIAGALLCNVTGASAASFKDVGDDYWGQKEINYLFEQKIINGYQNGLFQPNKPITKSQVALILIKALDIEVKNQYEMNFKDIPKTSSIYKSISAAIEAGIFPKETKFDPNKPMTKAEIAEVFVKAFDLVGTGKVDIKDVPSTSEIYEDISILVENDLIDLNNDGAFKPNEKVTRGEFAVYLARALNADFLPDQYNIPQNVNPVVILFNHLLKNPDGISTLFTMNNDYGFTQLSGEVNSIEGLELKEIARLNGTTEYVVQLNVDLKGANSGLLSDGANTLYFLIEKVGYMEYKIISVDKTPHLQADHSISFTKEKALEIFTESNIAYWYVVSGGEQTGKVETFTKNGIEYRFMSESLNTEEKLKAYLGQSYSPEQVEKLFKDLGFITHNGRLAQPNADGGSLLNFEKAIITQIHNSTTVKKYELTIPLGDTDEKVSMVGELHFVSGKGWRVHRFESTEAVSISDNDALDLFTESKKAYWNAVAGGEGKGTTETFTKDELEYRYMSEQLNTEAKLRAYLADYYTPEQVEKLFKDLGFITHKGQLAQPNADGGSLLNFEKATIKLLEDSSNVKKYELTVPLGETGEVETVKGELHYVDDEGWRVHSIN
nr:DL-endopeptidase inhibitor IseA family protein [Lysinibacillus timonensis]